MKTIILSASPYFKVLVIAGIILCSMAFRNPFAPQNETKIIQVKDTVPDTNMNINIDVSKIMAEVNKAPASIDYKKIMADVQQSLQKINFEKMQKQIELSTKAS